MTTRLMAAITEGDRELLLGAILRRLEERRRFRQVEPDDRRRLDPLSTELNARARADRVREGNGRLTRGY